MEYFNENSYFSKAQYPNNLENSFAYEPMNYSSENNVTYYTTNFRKPSYNRDNFQNDYRSPENYFTVKQNKLDEALEMIKNSVMDEINDEIFYSALINQAIEDEDKEIIMGIRDDEMKHNRLLRDVYYSLTGITLPQSKQENLLPTNTYLNNLKKALFGEFEAATKYRKIMNAMPDRKNSATLMEIMVDEIGHSGKYNFLVGKNRFNLLSKDVNEPTD